MRHGGKPKLAQQPTHHVGRARTRKNCAERIEGRSSGWIPVSYFSSASPPPGKPANITPTLHGNGSFSHSTRSHRVWMHMDEAIPHARARPEILCCAVHAVQR